MEYYVNISDLDFYFSKKKYFKDIWESLTEEIKLLYLDNSHQSIEILEEYFSGEKTKESQILSFPRNFDVCANYNIILKKNNNIIPISIKKAISEQVVYLALKDRNDENDNQQNSINGRLVKKISFGLQSLEFSSNDSKLANDEILRTILENLSLPVYVLIKPFLNFRKGINIIRC